MSADADCQHEARHIVGGWFGGQEVQGAAIGLHGPVDAAGIVHTAPSENGVAELLGRLLGWLGDPDLPERAVWPPPYPPPTGKGRDPDGVGWCVSRFGLSRRAYQETCRLAEELVENPHFSGQCLGCTGSPCRADDRRRGTSDLAKGSRLRTGRRSSEWNVR